MSVSLSDFEARKRRYKQQREAVRRQAAMVAAANNSGSSPFKGSSKSSSASLSSSKSSSLSSPSSSPPPSSSSSSSSSLSKTQTRSPSSSNLSSPGAAASARRASGSSSLAAHASMMEANANGKASPAPMLPPQLRLDRSATASKSFLERMIDRHAGDLALRGEEDEISRCLSFDGRPRSSLGLKSTNTSTRKSSRAEAKDEESSTLVSSMASRLSQVESARRQLSRKVADLEQEIARLSRENHRLRNSEMVELAQNQSQADSVSDVELNELRRENAEMKRFLRDYGMEWRGGDGEPAPIDFDRLLRALEELNALAGPSGVIQRDRQSRVFGLRDCRTTLDLLVFKNGILSGDGVFRPFDEPSGKAFMHDVEDGYFPSEFKTSHPAGVAFAIQDHRGEIHDPATRTLIAGQTGVRRLGPKEVAQQVPKYVIRDGEIVRPRVSLERFFAASGNAKDDNSDGLASKGASRDRSAPLAKVPKTICSLQEPLNVSLLVHFTVDEHSQSCVIKLNAEQTVADACQLLCCSATKLRFGQFSLRSAMPGERGRDFASRCELSMREAGWVPNAVLYVKDYMSEA